MGVRGRLRDEGVRLPVFKEEEYVTDMGNSPRVSAGWPMSFGCRGFSGSILKKDNVWLPGFTVKRY